MLSPAIYRDVFNLHKECEQHIHNPGIWDLIFWPRANALYEKYHFNPLCMGFLLEVHAELERTQKGGEKNGEG